METDLDTCIMSTFKIKCVLIDLGICQAMLVHQFLKEKEVSFAKPTPWLLHLFTVLMAKLTKIDFIQLFEL